jgi:formate dehydrogenase subunit gamma
MMVSQSPPWNEAAAMAIIEAHAGVEGPLLPILHEMQETFGVVGDEAVALIAAALNLTRAEVHGVVSFYHDFRKTPAGRKIVKLCRAEACQARGGREVQARVEQALGVVMGETTRDGAVTLEPVYCLGLCASGPAALVDGEPVARLTGARLDKLIAEARP